MLIYFADSGAFLVLFFFLLAFVVGSLGGLEGNFSVGGWGPRSTSTDGADLWTLIYGRRLIFDRYLHRAVGTDRQYPHCGHSIQQPRTQHHHFFNLLDIFIHFLLAGFFLGQDKSSLRRAAFGRAFTLHFWVEVFLALAMGKEHGVLGRLSCGYRPMMPMRFGLGDAGDLSSGMAAASELRGEEFAGAAWLVFGLVWFGLVHWSGGMMIPSCIYLWLGWLLPCLACLGWPVMKAAGGECNV